MEKKKIYTIMVVEKIEKGLIGLPDFGSSSLCGYYFDKDVAFETVKENACDINENFYDYAVIEEVEEGLYHPATSERWFFKYDKEKDQYEQIEEPDFLNLYCGFTIG